LIRPIGPASAPDAEPHTRRRPGWRSTYHRHQDPPQGRLHDHPSAGPRRCCRTRRAGADRAGRDERERLRGSLFDLRTGSPKTLPAYEPIETFPVRLDGDLIKLEVE